MNDSVTKENQEERATSQVPWIWRGLMFALFLALCFGPDPRPLGAPEWAVDAVRLLVGFGEPSARAVATLLLRTGGLALLGALMMLSVAERRWSARSVGAIVIAPCVAVAALWINFGYFPIMAQIQIASISTVLGALAGLALRRNRIAAASLVIVTGGLFVWGTSTGIDDEFDAATRDVGRHLLAVADQIPDGEEGFAGLLEIAFTFAAERSRDADPIHYNRAAVLALSVILGEEKIAKLAGRFIDRSRLPEAETLRARIMLYGRKDWPRHFWVSAGLTVLSDSDRSIVVGLTKELMDATPGGTGFSFSDLAADAAGNRFALAATRDAESARATQRRIVAGVRIVDFFPDVRDLPEGLTREVFQEEYGGLGGEQTQRIVDEIRQRLAACPGLR